MFNFYTIKELHFMPTKEFIVDCEIKTAESGNYRILYYLIASPSVSSFSNEATDGLVYGIGLTKEAILHGRTSICEEIAIGGFSYSKAQTINFIHKMAALCVTPMSLAEVTDDYQRELEDTAMGCSIAG